MKAAVVKKFGPAENIIIEKQWPIPEPVQSAENLSLVRQKKSTQMNLLENILGTDKSQGCRR